MTANKDNTPEKHRLTDSIYLSVTNDFQAKLDHLAKDNIVIYDKSITNGKRSCPINEWKWLQWKGKLSIQNKNYPNIIDLEFNDIFSFCEMVKALYACMGYAQIKE